jgi:hypothetical protein
MPGTVKAVEALTGVCIPDGLRLVISLRIEGDDLVVEDVQLLEADIQAELDKLAENPEGA